MVNQLMIEGRIIGLDDMAKWLEYHGCYAKKVGDLLEVKFPLMCKYLRFDKRKKKYKCDIHKKRPEICRAYFCDRAKED